MSQIGVWRAARIRAIHAACRAAGLDDEARHDLQRSLIGKASLSDMTLPELNTLLDHINSRSGYAGHAGQPKGIADDPQLQKIEALLADMKLPWAYIHKSKAGPSMVRRLTGKDRVEWADATGKQAVITALVKRQKKAQG